MAQAGEQPAAGLARLPPELFDKILFDVDTVRDLARFIATARFVYRRFSVQRRAVLFCVLQNELGPVLDDARFLFVFPYSDPRADKAAYIEWLRLMAVVYHEMLRDGNARSGMPVRGSNALPSLKELTGLCHTLYKINFLATCTSRHASPCSTSPAELAPPPRHRSRPWSAGASCAPSTAARS